MKYLKRILVAVLCALLVVAGVYLCSVIDKAAKSTATYFESQTAFRINSNGVTILNNEISLKNKSPE